MNDGKKREKKNKEIIDELIIYFILSLSLFLNDIKREEN